MSCPGQASEHDADHGQSDEGSDGAGVALEIACQAAIAADPGQGSFDDPSRALSRDPRARGTRGEPDGRDHRQPERQGRSKRGSALDPQGFDAGKKVTGRKHHILVDTLGLLLNVVVHPADVQGRDGARLVLDRRTRCLFPFIERIPVEST
jgi:hypothetical protein